MRRVDIGLIIPLILSIGILAFIIEPRTAASNQVEADSSKEPVGEVLGKPILRNAINKEGKLSSQLALVFLSPVLEQYKAAHKNEIKPTKDEIAFATVVLDQEFKKRAQENLPELLNELKKINDQLTKADLAETEKQKLERNKKGMERVIELNKKGPGQGFAVFMLSNWKFQKHLYDNYGGGRILWQQGGIEAFDAMHKWIEAREKAGDFKINDEEMRKELYAYWTTQNHGSFLISDPERIRKEFIEPAWVEKAAPKK